ncbi:MAG: MarR family transcriptional regulator [Cytophagales bacterium]|nr:MarR family transcriptional regulator [Cytophagales bacterium]
MIDIEKTLMPWIGKSMKVIDYFFMDRFARHNIELTKVQWILLKRLKEMNGESQHNLAFLTNRDKASLARLLTTMERKNLVARIPSDSDQRINRIYITSHGEKILKQAMPVVKEMIDEMQEGLTDEEKIITINVLKKLMNNIKSEELVALETK